jgi:hypothetical protein
VPADFAKVEKEFFTYTTALSTERPDALEQFKKTLKPVVMELVVAFLKAVADQSTGDVVQQFETAQMRLQQRRKYLTQMLKSILDNQLIPKPQSPVSRTPST